MVHTELHDKAEKIAEKISEELLKDFPAGTVLTKIQIRNAYRLGWVMSGVVFSYLKERGFEVSHLDVIIPVQASEFSASQESDSTASS